MPRQVLAQSAAQGTTSRIPLQCESSSHCISAGSGRKLTRLRLKTTNNAHEQVADLQQRQGDRPSGPMKSAAVATRAGVGLDELDELDGTTGVAGDAAAAAAVK